MASTTSTQLPTNYKGLYFTSPSAPPEIASFPTPAADVGSVIVKTLYCWIPGYINDVYSRGNPRQYPVPFPLIGGTNAVGRVVAVPPDAAKLKVGDLVVVDPTIRPRDDPGQIMLLALLAATGILSLQAGGRANLMSGVPEISIPIPLLQLKGITIQATMMCTWSQEEDLVKLVQTGVLKLGEKAGLKIHRAFKMEDFAEALQVAGTESNASRSVVFTPNEE
ncbi:hypothetical protein VdG1_04184 [Verticillium dahliae VDG1]|nr:hypothetical protein VdG1_04184 [Verticillium dahliae VDG1]